MKKIKYTNGTLSKLDTQYYTLVLFNNGCQVYTATLDCCEASNLVSKSNKITFA